MRKSPRGKKPSTRPLVSAPVSVVHVESSILIPPGLEQDIAKQRAISAGDLALVQPSKPLPPTPPEEHTRVNAFATMSKSSRALETRRPALADAFAKPQKDLPSTPPLSPSMDSGERNKPRLRIGRKYTSPDPKLEAKRSQIAREILETERSYCSDVGCLVSVYRKGFEASGVKLNPTKMATIFGNVDEVLRTSRGILEKLEARLDAWSPTQRLGDVFLQHSDSFDVYTQYIKGHRAAILQLDDWEKKKEFVQVMKDVEEANPGVKNMGNLLIMPVQRMPRYVMLLMSLLEKTPEAHPDYIDLHTALSVVTKMTEKVDELITLEENLQKTYSIQKKLGRKDLVAGDHVYIKDGDLMKQCRKVDKKRWFVLFTDILVYTNRLATMDHSQFELSKTVVRDVDEANAFQISSLQKSFIVYAESAAEKNEWVRVLQEHIAKNKADGDDEVEHAPVWVPDKEAKGCSQCDTQFSVINRRHHCRRCGSLVCGRCSSWKLVVENISNKSVRVCRYCYEEAQLQRGAGNN